MSVIVTQCYKCAFYIGDSECVAFPEGIPADILTGLFDHSKPFPDQKNNIVFEREILNEKHA